MWRWTPWEFIEVWEGVSLKLIMKDYGRNRQYVKAILH